MIKKIFLTVICAAACVPENTQNAVEQSNSMPSPVATIVPTASNQPLVTETPFPGGPASFPTPAPEFTLMKSAACYGEEIKLEGESFFPKPDLSDQTRKLVFSHPITRERSPDENPERYKILEVVPDENQNVVSQFILQREYPSLIGNGIVQLKPGIYVVGLEDEKDRRYKFVTLEVKDCNS